MDDKSELVEYLKYLNIDFSASNIFWAKFAWNMADLLTVCAFFAVGLIFLIIVGIAILIFASIEEKNKKNNGLH